MAIAAFYYARWIEPKSLNISRHAFDIHAKHLDGLKIAHLSDFHYRPKHDDALLEKIIATLHQETPDVIALTGDFVNDDLSTLPKLLDFLSQLPSRHGVFAVLGNHDGQDKDLPQIRREFERAGITLLINEHRMLSIGDGQFAIAGTDHVWYGNADLAETFEKIPEAVPILALVHEPDFFDQVIEHRRVMLQLSGHSHAGQCRVPWLGYAPIKVKYGRKYLVGKFTRDGCHLFVTRGVGTVGLPVRFACPPELAMLTLHAVELIK